MPLFHVGGIAWALLGLRSGGVTVVARDPSPAALVQQIAAHRVTHTFVVPAILQGLVSLPDLASHDLSSLDTVLYGASPISLPLLQRCLASLPCRLNQVYGMTEMSGVVTILDDAAHRDPARPERLLSAGIVAPGIEVRLVEPTTLQDVGPGEQGELWWRSAQRMREYWRKPEATAEAITSDGWLRSGDVATIEEGFVILRDRVKDMAISGGENVYPAEVERVLHHHPAVADAAVFGVPDEKWGEVMRAAVVRHPGQEATEAELIAHCREHLAHYKCPKAVDFVESLPRNPSGKVLKRILREPFWAGRSRSL
jgi:acyl-CoA synthetase (AMP-forming)/AMP-acid ligase II